MRTARQQYTRGASPAIPGSQHLASAFQSGGIRGFIRAAGGSNYATTWDAVERYARGQSAGRQLVNKFLQQLGPIGSILGAIVGHDTGGRGSLPSDLRYALDFVKAFADHPSVLSALQRVLEGRGAQIVWPSGNSPVGTSRAPKGGMSPATLADSIADAIEQAESGKGAASGKGGRGGNSSGGGRAGGGRGGRGGDELPPGGASGGGGSGDGRVEVNVDGQTQKFMPDHPLVTGAMIETPDSSNVFAFGFDNETHSLFVRFKDTPRKGDTHAGGFKIGAVFGGSSGMVRGRPHKPGALYLYHNVPARLFLTFVETSSKGSWVWDNLRIRGTVSGHRYDYALVGVQGGYVPRKATLTPLGETYIPRTIFTDQGRSLSSSLPEELVRPLRPGMPSGGLGRPPNDGRGGLGGGGRGRGR